MRMRAWALGVGLAAALPPAAEGVAETRTYALPEETAAFRPGPGVEAAQNNCLSCHSADYVNMQPPGLGAKFWEAEVSKMVEVYRAPIAEADAKAIAAYLTRTY